MFSKWRMLFCAVVLGLIVYVKPAAILKTSKSSPILTSRNSDGDSEWWKHAVFYQIYPRSFKDDNNDGIGDLKGITSKLKHLKDAGVTATWLSPIFKSPQVDQGYDISDFKDIDEDYGTLEDFDELVQKAQSLGIKIILDFVPNHSSDKHEWFIKSENREPDYEDFYIWRDGVNGTAPNNWLSLFKYSAWKYSEKRKQYYYHAFAEAQPDLNYRNPLVVDAMKDVLKFWMDRGVDGFRMDAVPHLFEDEDLKDEPKAGNNVPPYEHAYLKHIYTTDLPETYDMIYEWRRFIEEYSQEHGGDARIMMTEAYTNIENTMRYYGEGERKGAHFSFNFQFITKLNKKSTARDIVGAVEEWMDNMPSKYTANWVLGNHDNARVATRLGSQRVDGMNMLAALLPGVMVTYNGEEIGQENGEVTWEEGQDPNACNGDPNNFDKVSRDFERTPFHWDDSVNGGFNDGKNPWLPVSEKYKTNNLAAQKVSGSKSHYRVYQELLKLRQLPAFAKGSLRISAFSTNVLAFVREAVHEPAYVVVINIGNKNETVDISSLKGVKQSVKVIATDINSNKRDSVLTTNKITLEAYESFIATVLPDPDWWKHAVFYQIYPRSFKDDNNDGIGDLKGITSKLEHLRDAGITAAWLSPIYKSPQVDQGYDISDFMDIHPEYGTLEEFDLFVEKAHALGIKVIMDFVPNHSSNQHQWFIDSENEVEEYKDYYIWKDGKPDNKPPNNWKSLFKGSAWSYSTKRQQWYLHQFAKEQPDLNYRNVELNQNMKDVLKFWMDRKVDGFRMDAVPYLVEHESFEDEPLSNDPNAGPDDYEYLNHTLTSDQPETFDVIYDWREFIEEYNKAYSDEDPRVLMAEAYTDIDHTMLYYGDENRDGAHFPFNFLFITELSKTSSAEDIVAVVNKWLSKMPEGRIANWVLGNHDKHRVATRFGPERVDGMNMLNALLPGIMVTYNGEEIGQENGEVTFDQGQDPSACKAPSGDFDKISRDFERTPFHWDNTVNAGFNEGHKPWLPVSEKYTTTNLAAQSVPGIESHYQIYKHLLQIRQEPAFVNGALKIVALSKNVLGFTREAVSGNSYVILINIANTQETINLSTFPSVKRNVKVIIGSVNSIKKERLLASDEFTLEAYESVVAKILPDVTLGDQDWWKTAVFYQIYPRSFKDDDNDGIGDLQGIISKLGHLKDAGITAAWLSPIYKSPQVDQGYDISDFLDTDRDYGTLDDLDTLLQKAHALGIKIVMDFVPNHSSDKHLWFIKSEKGEKGYEDFYIWKDGTDDGNPPNNWISRFKYSAWKYSEKRKQYYLHQFAEAQPDLNYRNPVLVKKMKDVLKFWLDKGVDGFRMDAVPFLFEDKEFRDEPLSGLDVSEDEYEYLQHIYTNDVEETFDMIYQWRAFLDDYVKEHGGDARVMMTEAYTDIENTMKYYGNDTHDGAHFTFNFELITQLNSTSDVNAIVATITNWLKHLPDRYVSNWVLGNHDNSRVATKFGPENVDGLNMLIALLPGIMVTYNGEEIGQENGEVTWEEGWDPNACNGDQADFERVSRDFERTPFHWDTSVNAGFNNGTNPWLPVSKKYLETNLAAQSDPDVISHYQIYKSLLNLRKEPTIVSGSLNIVAIADSVLVYTRTLDDNPTYMYLFNIGSNDVTVDINSTFPDTPPYLQLVLKNTVSTRTIGNTLPVDGLTLAPHECIVAIPTDTPSAAVNARISVSMFFVIFSVLLFV